MNCLLRANQELQIYFEEFEQLPIIGKKSGFALASGSAYKEELA